jgi:uncharacterized protein
VEFVFDGPATARRTIALAHGAGAGMDTPFLAGFATGLAERDFRVARFEFPYWLKPGGRRKSARRIANRCCALPGFRL